MNNIYTQTADNTLLYSTSNERNRYKTNKIIKKIYAAAILLALAALISQNAWAQNTNTFQNVRVMNSAKLDYMQDTVIEDRFVVVDKDGNLKASGLRTGGGSSFDTISPFAVPWDPTLPCPHPAFGGGLPIWRGGNNENIYVCPINTRVGIGVVDPQRKLHVKGITEVCTGPPENCNLPVEDRNTTYIRISDQEIDEDDGSLQDLHEWDMGGGKSFTLGKVSKRTMFIISDNNRVGIGTSPGLPNATLDVRRTPDDPSGNLFRIRDGGTTKFIVADTGNVGIKRANPAYPLDVNGAVNSNGYFINGIPLQTGLWSDGAGSIYYTGGDVGIGTNTPGYKLDVAGSVNASSYYLNGSPLPLGVWNTNGSKIYYNNGNIGIGTNDADELLHVEGAHGKLRVGESNNYISMGFDGAHNIIEANGAGTLLINYYSNKDVAIGGDLSVCSKLWVHQSSWCDFVFDENHQRMSFEDRDQYYRTEKKLPMVPSEGEMLDTGMDIGNTMKGFVFNLEEISLNQIDLYKMIIAQQKEIAKLSKELETLKKQ